MPYFQPFNGGNHQAKCFNIHPMSKQNRCIEGLTSLLERKEKLIASSTDTKLLYRDFDLESG